MAISRDEIIRDNLRTLDQLEGEGLFQHDKRDMTPKTRYLIISYGGTGSDVLEPLRKRLKEEIEEGEYKKKIRILAIDTDTNTRHRQVSVKDEETGQTVVKNEERFAPEEFLWLDGTPARANVDNNILDGTENWLNPQLLAEIRADKKYLDGNGASSTRQVGRLLLSPRATRDGLRNKILALAHELTDDNNDDLEILIITGISGGTGSGIVIDATYLIRSYIESIPALTDRVKYGGFVLLPPTGKSNRLTDVEKGNRNGYAALKEIDYFMTLRRYDLAYDQTFGNDRILVEKNLFDVCYLIDGSIPGMGFANARDRATEVISDCVVDMVTSQQVVGAAAPQRVESFLSDASAFAKAMQESNPPRVMPRDANYIYCALGHGQTLIPLDLMKGYVAKKIYDRMYRLFKNCGNVEPTDVETFLRTVQCPDDGATAGRVVDAGTLTKSISAETDRIFKITDGSKGGPYYTINLLKDAAAEAEKRIANLRSRAWMAGRKADRLALLETARKRFLDLNNNCFNVYTMVMEQMNKYLEKVYGIITDENHTTDTYYFQPIWFGGNDAKSRIVQEYLDKLVSKTKTQKLCEELVNQMVSNRAAWTNLYGRGTAADRFDAAHEIRKFWEKGVNKVLDATLEDFLIKYYTGDPDAGVQKMPDGTLTAKAQQGLKLAAQAIVEQMFSSGFATPLASLNVNILQPSAFNPHQFVLIPQKAPNLKRFVEDEIKIQYPELQIKDTVFESGSNDRISCYAQYTCIPAYILTWAKQAETDYERQIHGAGIHISETSGGNNWRSFPNLVNQTIWPLLGGNYTNPREAKIAEGVGELFDKASEYGLTVSHTVDGMGDYSYYELKLFPGQLIPSADLFKAMDTEADGTPAWKEAAKALEAAVTESARKLFEKADWETMEAVAKGDVAETLTANDVVSFEKKAINPSGQVWTAGANKPNGWDEDLAKKLLRKDLDTTYVLRGTLAVLDALYPMIEQAQAKKSQLGDFAKYFTAGLFYKPEGDTMWMYSNERGYEEELVEIPFGVRAAELTEEFMVFQAYAAKAADIRPAMEEQLADLLTPTDEEIQAAGGRERIAKNKKKSDMIEKAKTLGAAVSAKFEQRNPDNIVTKAFEREASDAGIPVAEVRDFYRSMQETLNNGFATLLMKY